MQIINKRLTQKDFRKYVKEFNFGTKPPTSLVIHHTWKPKKKDWNGQTNIDALKRYYESKGWDAGPHIFVAQDGIWLFTSMYEIGIHAGNGNATWVKGDKKKYGYSQPYGYELKGYSVGIEVVGDYDTDIWTGKTKSNALAVIRILMDQLKLQSGDVKFHRDFSNKSCPGHAITKEWLFAELTKKDAKNNTKEITEQPSSWAREAWEWQRELGLDLMVRPREKVSAEWVFAIIYKALKLNHKK